MENDGLWHGKRRDAGAGSGSQLGWGFTRIANAALMDIRLKLLWSRAKCGRAGLLTLSASFSSRFLFCERVTACSAFPPETPSTVGVWETGVISGSNPTGVACGVETSPMTISNLNTLC